MDRKDAASVLKTFDACMAAFIPWMLSKMYRTSLFGPIALIQKVLAVMRAKKSGAIINVSFIAAYEASVANGFYASSKAASS